jgi:hypothetical protein
MNLAKMPCYNEFMAHTTLADLADDALIAETRRVAAVERQSTAELLGLLNEVERRRLHLALGHSSLFAYCTRALAMSEHAAYSRITAARASRRFPALVDRLASGALTLSSIGILAPHLTEENVAALLEAADGRSTREVERLIAALHPQPDVATSLRALPIKTATSTDPVVLTLLDPAVQTVPAVQAPCGALDSTRQPPAPTRVRPAISPIAPTRYVLRITIGEEAHAALTRLRALLRHRIPDGDLAAIVSQALAVLLAETERTRFAAVHRERPTQAPRPARGRHIPAAVRRAVWRRDQGRCTFVGSDGRCDEPGFLEFHHVVPFAAGGATDITNLQLRCRAHNAYEALAFGRIDAVDSATPGPGR